MKKSKASNAAAADALGALFEGISSSGVLASSGEAIAPDELARMRRSLAAPSNAPKYPEITVQLLGRDGNAFSVLGAVRRALRENGVSPSEIAAFLNEATSGDYDALLRTCMKWVEVA